MDSRENNFPLNISYFFFNFINVEKEKEGKRAHQSSKFQVEKKYCEIKQM